MSDTDNTATANMLPPADKLERRRQLIAALRQPMPPAFTWDFNTVFDTYNCYTAGCAIGLAYMLWPGLERPSYMGWDPEDPRYCEFWGLSHYAMENIFYIPHAAKTTAAMVADALETTLPPSAASMTAGEPT